MVLQLETSLHFVNGHGLQLLHGDADQLAAFGVEGVGLFVRESLLVEGREVDIFLGQFVGDDGRAGQFENTSCLKIDYLWSE